MRPPAKQAENERRRRRPGPGDGASMRPPAKQAENGSEIPTRRPASCRFNEAACKTGGKRLENNERRGFRKKASMRPPAKQAENAGGVTVGDALMGLLQ